MHIGTSRLRALAGIGKVRAALVLSGIMGLALVATALASAPHASAAGQLRYYWKAGYYLDNGWLCYGWSNGAYHCTQHWHRDASGRLISDNARWVPNLGTVTSTTTHTSTSTTHATTTHADPPAKHTTAPVVRKPAPVYHPAPAAAPASGGSVQAMISSTFGSYAGAALAVARCESGYNPNAHNPSGASGVFQFLPSTWRTTSYAGYSPYNAWANIHAAYQVFQRDGYSWREWQCKP